jgi:hypothetical protein
VDWWQGWNRPSPPGYLIWDEVFIKQDVVQNGVKNRYCVTYIKYTLYGHWSKGTYNGYFTVLRKLVQVCSKTFLTLAFAVFPCVRPEISGDIKSYYINRNTLVFGTSQPPSTRYLNCNGYNFVGYSLKVQQCSGDKFNATFGIDVHYHAHKTKPCS